MGIVYEINIGKFYYIGSTTRSLYDRKKEHLYKLRHNIHSNKKLSQLYSDMGEGALSFSIIEECDDKHLTATEAETINSYITDKGSSLVTNEISPPKSIIKPDDEIENIKWLYYHYRFSLKEIAFIFKTCSSSIKRTLKLHGLPIRPAKNSRYFWLFEYPEWLKENGLSQ